MGLWHGKNWAHGGVFAVWERKGGKYGTWVQEGLVSWVGYESQVWREERHEKPPCEILNTHLDHSPRFPKTLACVPKEHTIIHSEWSRVDHSTPPWNQPRVTSQISVIRHETWKIIFGQPSNEFGSRIFYMSWWAVLGWKIKLTGLHDWFYWTRSSLVKSWIHLMILLN